MINHNSTLLCLINFKKQTVTVLQSLKILSVLVAIRLDEKPDTIENILTSSLMNEGVASSGSSFDLLASSTWEKVL